MMLKRAFVPITVLSLALAANAAAQSMVPDSAPAIGPAKSELFNRIIANQKKRRGRPGCLRTHRTRREPQESRRSCSRVGKNRARDSFGDGHVPDTGRR